MFGELVRTDLKQTQGIEVASAWTEVSWASVPSGSFGNRYEVVAIGYVQISAFARVDVYLRNYEARFRLAYSNDLSDVGAF